jgi:glucose-1-phosphate adenylyltransferase
MRDSVLSIVMAGGTGTRLYPLTSTRAKPAVPFGGRYRLIDFVLSNLINSGFYSVYVLTQFRAQSLIEHIQDGWRFGGILKKQFVTVVPAQLKKGEDWYRGTADALYQNIDLIKIRRPKYVAVFGADHIYRMDVSQMLKFHQQLDADISVSALPFPCEDASGFGIIDIDKEGLIQDFVEKPQNPPEMPGRPGWALASMGNYIFNTDLLIQLLEEDAADPSSDHDFGKNVLPKALAEGRRMACYDFTTNVIPGMTSAEEKGYWRDVGTIKNYWEANMDLRAIAPIFDLYNLEWPLRTAVYPDPPAKFAFDEPTRRGAAINSIVAEGSIISGGEVKNSVIGRNVFIHSYARVEDSIIMDRVHIGRSANLRRCIVDKFTQLPDGISVGYDPDKDRTNGFTVDEASGITVVPRNWGDKESPN